MGRVRFIVAIVIVQLSVAAYGQKLDSGEAAKGEKNNLRLKVTISKETTDITRPIGEDGYVDYCEALNRLSRQGVTADNNAAIPLLLACGLKWHTKEGLDEFAQRLGVKKLPEQDEFLQLPQWHEDEELDKQLSNAARKPWNPKQYPRVARLLGDKRESLKYLTQVGQRSKYHSPLSRTVVETVSGEVYDLGVFAASDQLLSEHGNAVRVLLARAMLRLDEGKSDAAWKDLLTAHRLTRFVGQSPTIHSAGLSFRSEREVCEAERTFLLRADLSLKQLRQIQKDFAALPPLPDLAERFDRAGRWSYIDAVIHVAEGGFSVLKLVNDLSYIPREDLSEPATTYVSDTDRWGEELARFSLTSVNWNYILRAGNQWHDQIVKALRMPAGRERMKVIGKLADEHGQIRAMAGLINERLLSAALCADLAGAIAAGVMGQPVWRLAFSNLPHTGWVMTEPMKRACLGLIMENFQGGMEIEDRTITQLRLTQVTTALATYRREHGKYPSKLSELPGDSVKGVTEDLYCGRMFEYRKAGKNFELLSVGLNGKRDTADEDDDVVVRSDITD